MYRISRLAPLLVRLGKDQRGSILIQAALTIVVIMGMIGLALDGGRFFMVNNDLQDLADAAALAGAARLDGTAGAMAAADNAARNLNNDVRRRLWDVSGPKILSGQSGVSFYEKISDIDAGKPLSPNNPANDKLAKYIKVTTGSWQVSPTFLTAVGANSNNSTLATAVAQALFSTCVPLPLLLCNPSEPIDGSSTGDASSFSAQAGWMFHFKLKGGAGPYSPGDFNLLDPPGTNNPSASALEDYLAQVNLGGCNSSGASPAPGQKTNPIANGINVRFDQPNGSGDASTSAPIVIDGLSPTGAGNSCKKPGLVTPTNFDPTNYSATCNAATPSDVSCPLPRDRSLTAVGSSGIGQGPNLTDLQAYWQNHHSGSLTVATRYEIYKQEASNPADFTAASNTAEPHGPQCSDTTGDASRRVISAAIIDCSYWGVKGSSVENIPILKYGDFFITEPSPTGAGSDSGTIYTEFIGAHNVNQNGSGIHKTVQLVR
jgi:Putative Flp pilus-assembly TadE/G-like